MLAPKGVVVRASDVVVFNNFVFVVDARDGHRSAQKLLVLDSQAEAYSTSTVGVVQSRVPSALRLHLYPVRVINHNRSTLERCAP
jgi:hypothetical protein